MRHFSTLGLGFVGIFLAAALTFMPLSGDDNPEHGDPVYSPTGVIYGWICSGTCIPQVDEFCCCLGHGCVPPAPDDDD
ncbi:MAG: hypothetical protein WD960_07355 [Gemmatimonadota bacterium]